MRPFVSMRNAFLLSVTCVLLFASGGNAATYHVRTDGDDSNDGLSSGTAWKTIQKAANMVVAGDTVYVGDGTYDETISLVADGTVANPIQFFAETAGNVVVQSSSTHTFDLNDANHIRLDGLTIRGGTSVAVYIRGGAGIVFANCDMSNSVYVFDTENCDFSVFRCQVHDSTDDAFEIGSGTTILVQDSQIYAAGYDGFHTNTSSGSTITIQRCRIYDNGRHGIRTDGCSVSLSNCLLTGNGNGSYGYGEGIHVQSNSSTLIEHCSIINNNRYGVKSQNSGSTVLKNSIIAFNGSYGLRAQDGGTFSADTDYNLVYGNGAVNYFAVTPGANDIVADPQFVGGGDYHLQDGSPAIDSGTGAMAIDLDRKPRPSGAEVDRGCYEDGPVTYYVRASGDDNNSGASPAQAFRTISQAAGVASEGATVYVGGGTYLEGVILDKAGTSSEPIRFLADTSGAETGDAGPVVVTPPADLQYGWTLQNAHYTSLEGFRISGDGQPQANGLTIDNSQSVTIKDCEIDNTVHGIRGASSTLILDNCLVRDTVTAGIWLENTSDADLQVTNLTLTDNGQFGLVAEGCQLTFDASNIGNWVITGADHLFSASGGNLTFDGVTISGGNTAGVLADAATLTVRNAVFQNNGYGVAALGCNVLIEDTTLSQNSVGFYSSENTSVMVRNCALQNNTVWGAAVYACGLDGATATFENCTIESNGGGLALVNAFDGDLLLRLGTVIRDNTNVGLDFVNCDLAVDDQAGGVNWSVLRNGKGICSTSSTLLLEGLDVTESTSYAIYSADSDLNVRDCTLTGRDGIYCGNNSTSTVDATRVISTVGGVASWGIYRDEGDVLVRNCVVRGFQTGIYLTAALSLQADIINTTIADVTNDGLQLDSGPARLVNTVIVASSGQYGVIDSSGQLTHSHNLVHGFSSPFQGAVADATETLKSPRFVDAASGDYHLGLGSPAINAGLDLGSEVPTDIDNNARPSFQAFDIGAFEYVNANGSLRVLTWSEKK